ncbi:MAG: RNA-directed DNA polymerase [Alphaproteobacteria bacterium]|nr:RNA-directed DNA polymerase [Alphaproteobacteria bacterium]
MPRRHDDLFERIGNFRALMAAARRAVASKRKKPGAAGFFAGLERNVLRLERELRDGTWRPGRYLEIEVFDPKHRIVSAAPFRDRVVHHALCAVIEPIFERGFIHDSYANRAGKGTHTAVDRYEGYRDRHAHVLRADIYRYFPAIDHAILKADLRRRIACPRTLALIDAIIDGSNPQEPVNLHFPGDDLFAPYIRRRGLPIGNLTSQFFANVHLDGLDHFAKEVLRAPYVRYVDDFALFHDDPAVLEEWRVRIGDWLAKRRLRLHPRKTFIAETREPAQFLGYVLLAEGLRRLPEDGVSRFRGRLRGLRDRWRAGNATEADIRARIGAWIAHAGHADTWRLRAAIFRDGWFDPAGRRGGLAGPLTRPSRRLLEQQSEERPLREPQQEHDRQSERQQRLPRRQHATMPEPDRSRTIRARQRASRVGHDDPVMLLTA